MINSRPVFVIEDDDDNHSRKDASVPEEEDDSSPDAEPVEEMLIRKGEMQKPGAAVRRDSVWSADSI